MKLDILQGRLPVPSDLATDLAALALQCESPKHLDSCSVAALVLSRPVWWIRLDGSSDTGRPADQLVQ